MKQKVTRRKPTQKRARHTRELILETAVRMLEEDGLEAFNTNRLAERSGYSVGTLYQYFADKQAILRALAEEEQEKRLQQIRAALADPPSPETMTDADRRTRIRTVLRIVLRAFDGRQRARRILIDLALQGGQHEKLNRPAVMLAAILSTGRIDDDAPGSGVSLSATDAFVLTRSVAGAIRSAVAEQPQLLKDPAFEDALVTLVEQFMAQRLGPSPTAQ